jgi:hypothetical protein
LVQQIAAAASAAVGVLSGSSITVPAKPQARRTQRIAWLLHQDGADVAVAVAGADIGDLETCWVERESDRHGLDGAVRSLTWRVIEGSAGSVAAIAEAIRAAGASTLVAAGPETLDGVLRDLVDLPSGTGRFRFIPGVPTTPCRCCPTGLSFGTSTRAAR